MLLFLFEHAINKIEFERAFSIRFFRKIEATININRNINHA